MVKRVGLKRKRSAKKRSYKRSSYVKYRKGRRIRAPGAGSISINPLLGLSACARDYAKVLMNPFSPGIQSAPCVPDYRAIPSAKFYLRCRGAFKPSKQVTTLTPGIGFVILDPFRPNEATGAVGPAIIYTDGTASTNPFTELDHDTTATGVSAAYLDTTLTYNDFIANGVKNKFRVVAAGLKVQYTGQSDDRQGHYIKWRHPSNQRDYVYQQSPTMAKLLEFEDTVYCAIDQGIHQVLYKPIDNDDFEYQTQASTNLLSNGIMGICTENTTADATFIYEAIVWYEAIGPTMRGDSPSHVDLGGLGQAMSLSNMLRADGSRRTRGKFSLNSRHG